jgi:hypothetical protein
MFDSRFPAAMSSTHEPTRLRLRAQPVSIFTVVFAVIFVGCLRPSLAALPCGAQPEDLPADVAQQITSDTDNNANLFTHAPASVSLRGLVTAKRRELWQKYPSVDKSVLDHYLLWATCQTISKDPTLAVDQKFDNYSNFYRLLSEPLKGAGPAE